MGIMNIIAALLIGGGVFVGLLITIHLFAGIIMGILNHSGAALNSLYETITKTKSTGLYLSKEYNLDTP